MFHETKALFKLASPIALTALIFYTRSIISMLFLGHIGDIELATGSLAIAFANITAYSVLAGLALGLEPLCSQVFGANQGRLISLTLHRTVIFLLVVSIPITFLWINSSHILNYFHQDPNITHLARTYLLFSLPDLVSNSFIHPTHIYLRAQGITYPLAFASLVGTVVQLPLNYGLVSHFGLGLVGVARSSNMMVVVYIAYVFIVEIYDVIVCLTNDYQEASKLLFNNKTRLQNKLPHVEYELEIFVRRPYILICIQKAGGTFQTFGNEELVMVTCEPIQIHLKEEETLRLKIMLREEKLWIEVIGSLKWHLKKRNPVSFKKKNGSARFRCVLPYLDLLHGDCYPL
ncbi:Multi antimicrobial extrusion protein [Artemisia annua]|uniref:Multi antimicrobial extrusion protein n=1 Tax=Artemisia annua TaxID=35608 RepID=A0A2U1PK83_ARTAN|nr:Multi antimicrobial extrusion protein [Artemisia annua]